jgi:hypothetical protein
METGLSVPVPVAWQFGFDTVPVIGSDTSNLGPVTVQMSMQIARFGFGYAKKLRFGFGMFIWMLHCYVHVQGAKR